MKTRKILWMLAAILFCGVAAMFTSCTNEDNPVKPVDNLSEKIIGTWITADVKPRRVKPWKRTNTQDCFQSLVT